MKGWCPICEENHLLDKDGKLVEHDIGFTGHMGVVICFGSGKLPERLVED